MTQFTDRYEAGKILAKELKEYKNRSDVIVLALPRGGVPVAFEIAEFLSVPLDVFIVRKLGFPGHEEFAMGAIADGGVVIFNEQIIEATHIPEKIINHVIEIEEEELNRRKKEYRDDNPFPKLQDKTIILVDDGIATGATMRVAVKALRQHHPKSIVIAVPIASKDTAIQMEHIADKFVCPVQPSFLNSVGQWYHDFSQTSDEEVHNLLNRGG